MEQQIISNISNSALILFLVLFVVPKFIGDTWGAIANNMGY